MEQPARDDDLDGARAENDYRLRVGASPPTPVPDRCPERHCDVIMKGGITSGVIYPMAGVELAAKYTLKSIGGTSAGAIAAAFFAAAEYRRSVGGSAKGFAALRAIPALFSSKVRRNVSFLETLFLPSSDAARLFRLLIAFLGEEKAGTKVRRVLGVVCSRYPLSFLGSVAGVLLVILGLRASSPVLAILSIAVGLLVAIAGFAVAAAAVVAVDAITQLSRHKFGLCPGTGEPVAGDPKPLSDWIEESLDSIAFGGAAAASIARPSGYEPGDPLTFGDLWGVATEADADVLAKDARKRRINLEVMTTNLTQGRPYRLPIDADHLYFDPRELEDVFSPRILDFLRRRGRQPTTPEGEERRALARERHLLPLPEPADLPVAVAVRLSLSFPLLISAVPLWGFDFSEETLDRKGRRGQAIPKRSWFTDGGITSNFPVHFFDGPIPRWPTFAFNLTPFPDRFPPEKEEALNIWLPNRNGDGLSETWSSPPEHGALRRLLWFLFEVVGTMQNWRDNLQLKVPGFRDRVAQIHQSPNEGGLNLRMKKERIHALSERGRIAAHVLADRFSDDPPEHTVLNWDNHAWVRLRTTMGLLETYLARIEAAKAEKDGRTTYDELIAEEHTSYPFADRATAARMLEELHELSSEWGVHDGLLSRSTPRPASDLRTMPKV